MLPVFEESTHAYRIGDRIIPSVTSILKAAGLIATQWMTDEARERGTAVHSTIHYFEDGDLDQSSVCREAMGYFSAYQNFKKDSGWAPVYVEQIVYSPGFNYAGRVDAIGWLNGRRVLIDFKTGPVPAWIGLQLQAYKQAFNATPDHLAQGINNISFVNTCFSLALRRDGSYRLTEHNDPRDFALFINARNQLKTEDGIFA